MNTNDYAVKERRTCYLLNGILIVPHYNRKGWFVGPGHQESNWMKMCWTEDFLRKHATPITEFIWKRNWS